MKIIVKSIGIAIFNLIVLFFLKLLFDHMGGLISGSFSGGLDIKDWWYELKRDNMLYYLIGTAGLSGGLCMIYEIVDEYVKNRSKFIAGIVIGEVSVLILVTAYWNIIQSNCYGYEWSTLELAMSISYGNNVSQTIFWMVYSGLMFFIGIFVNRFEVLIRTQDQKIIWHQVYSGEKDFCRMLYAGVPYGLFLSGTYFIVGFMGITVMRLFVIFSFAVVLYFFTTRTIRFSVLRRYYHSIVKDSSRRDHLVVVQESEYVKQPFFIYHLYSDHTLDKMKNKGIWFLPFEMGVLPENFIKLDTYDEWMFIRKTAQKKKIFDAMSVVRGTFNIAFAPNGLTSASVKYDGEYASVDSLTAEIERLVEYLDYKKTVAHELDNIDFSKLSNADMISEEIAGFKRYMETLTDDFLSFDYAIKWLEIVNYLFALVAFSKNDQSILNHTKKIGYADFGRWREILKSGFKEDKELGLIMNTKCNDVSAFGEFEQLWQIVTSRQYDFEKHTVLNLLDAANKLRNYTRGHGVFTFDISQGINIGLIRILVFLINRLIEYLNTAGNIGNLEKLGWVIYSGDNPYYLYYIDSKFKEYRYESFEKGNSISLPLDISRGDAL